MLEAMVKHDILFYAMGILTAFGVLAKMISNLTVRKMVKEASNIHNSNHKLMRLVKAKFEHASMISDKVQNVDAFVSKYIYEYKVWGMRVGSWSSLSYKSLWLVAMLGVLAVVGCFRVYGIGTHLYQYMQWTSIFSLFLVIACLVVEDKSKMVATKNYMVEYLENVCSKRYERRQQAEQEEEEPVVEEVVSQETKQVEEVEKKTEQEMRIRAILEEFLA